MKQQGGCKPLSHAKVAEIIANDFYNNEFDLSARVIEAGKPWELMPEVKSVKRLRGKVSKRTIRLFVTFISAMDRKRDSTDLWRDGITLFESCPDVFEPTKCIRLSPGELRDLLSESKVSKFHGPDAHAWHKIANLLYAGRGPVCKVIEHNTGDAAELLKDLQIRQFMLLKGCKIGPMWVRIMANPEMARIDRLEIVPVAVDDQVRHVTENLGITDTKHLSLEKARPKIKDVWRSAAANAKIVGPPDGQSSMENTCAALDPALWFFGRHGCSHCRKKKRRVPISKACNNCRFAA